MARDATQEKKQQQLEELLRILAESQDFLAEPKILLSVKKLLETIYTPDFRHLYSGVFSSLTQIDKSPELNLEILAQNIQIIYEEIKQHDCQDKKSCFCDKVIKLYDHLNLDIARMNYMRDIAEQQELSLESAVNSLNTKIKESEQAIQANEEHVAGFEDKIADKLIETQKNYVAILGIFAAIVITFVSGLVFSSSILNNIHQVTIYRLSFVILLLGFVLVNLINILIEFVREVCPTSSLVPKNSQIMTNKIMVGLMVILILCWVADLIVLRSHVSGWLAKLILGN